eukprot:TRINITY_DN31897_c0_g1_i1.p1 TRINITY_DN31897_c0_g1~~TRINITY_DN31897_c0_g1_i1.p1  ORF type:complete len:640 (-),score=97.66 TRINITY_DN31897_c0_g1_i1:353-2050(-)
MAGVLAITDRFPTGPEGDPAPMEGVDFDKELTTVGVGSMLSGLLGGTLSFHTFTAIQLRLDGGTHRIAQLAFVCAVGGAFMSSAPVGQFVPKWFLGGLFMNTAINFLKGSLLSYRSLPPFFWNGFRLPNPQYATTVFCILVAVFLSPAHAIGTGLVLSVLIFLVQSTVTSPVINVVVGNRVVSRTMRPIWEMKTLRKEGDRILLLYLQGQLFFGTVRSLVATLAAAAETHRVEYCILSFARVATVDASAARHLKTTADRVNKKGCRIIFCRMNREVFSALTAAGVVKSPDENLLSTLQGLRWRTKATHSKEPEGLNRVLLDHGGTQDDLAGSETFTHSMLLAAPSEGEPDSFAHETDALDYCDELLIDKYCYGSARDSGEKLLKPYMLEYRTASITEGVRLVAWAFEEMNGLPQGTVEKLRPFCEVRENVEKWTKLQDVGGELVFIMRGYVSLTQIVPKADEADIVQPEIRGFSFRQGKRLLKRLPPGYVVGKHLFFLRRRELFEADPEFQEQVVVSSKLGSSAELWILRAEVWETMPEDLRGILTEMLCHQLADASHHSRLQER